MLTKKLLAVSLSFCLLLAGCTSKKTESPGGTGALPGETVETKLLSFSATEFSFTDTPVGEISPGKDQRLLVVKVEVKNTSGQEITVYFDDFELEAGEEKRFPEFPQTPENIAEETILKNRDTLSGTLLFLVPAKTKEARLLYDEYFEGDLKGESYWVTLNLE
ncbi:DUF4352 domain-containing protein [Oscillospiraceae bacterium MB08-C2-2]|nr:DUF4352 domain-containing protein [Oscillospiraceae bacterium MB08-C2-2]